MADEFIDSSAGHTEDHTPTITGATIDTTTYKYGGGSGYFGSNSEVEYNDSDDWYFPDDFTISAWVYITATFNTMVMGQYVNSGNFMRIAFTRVNTFINIETSAIRRVSINKTYSALSDGWHHFEIGCDKDVSGYIFIDGVKQSSLNNNTYAGVGNIAKEFSVGSTTVWSTTYIDCLKIDKGICRHTSNFTVPADEDVDNDEYTVLYLKMNATYSTAWKKSLADSISFTETIRKDFGKPVSQSFSLSDTFSRTWGLVRSFTDNFSLSDLYSKLWTSKRNVNDPLPLSDSERKNISKQLVEDINFSDVFVSSFIKLLALSDIQTISDNMSYIWQSKKNIQDHIDFIENHGVYFEKRLFTNFSLKDIVSAYIPPKFYLFIADKLGTNSSLVKFFNKSLNDIGSLNEIKEFVVGKNFSDYMNLHDTRFLVSTLIRNISDSISLSDIKKLSIGKPVSDSVGVSEDVSISAIKGIIDNLSLSDIFSHISSFSKSIADNVSVLDSYTREWIAKRNIVESFTLQETKEVDYKKSSADYLSLDDSDSKLIGKNLNDSSSLFDTLSTAWTVLKSIADNASLSDLNFFSVKKNIDDSTGLVDFFLYVRGRYLSLSDLQVLADNITKGIFKSEQEQINFIDYHGVYMEKRTLDNLNLRDVFTSYMQGFLSIAEGVSVTDNVKKVFNKVMLSAESLLDNIIKKYSKNLYDIVSLGDTTLLYMNNTYYISMFNKIDLYDAIAKRIILYKDDNLSLIAELKDDGYLALQDNITLTDHLSMKVMKVLGEVIPITDDITQLLESEPFYFDHGLVEPVFIIEDLRVYGGAEMHFYPEQSVDVRWKTRYFVNDLLFDPDSHEITVLDPKGITRVVNNPAYLIKESIGVYKYTFNIPADVVSGDWRVKIKGIKGTWASVLNIHLEVRKT